MNWKKYWLPGLAGWAMIGVCSLASCPEALGQFGPFGRPSKAKAPALRNPPPVTSTETARTDKESIMENRIRVALLSDPETFALELEIYKSPSAYKISGRVPNHQTRKKVLDIAVRHGVPIMDDLQVVRGLAVRSPQLIAPEELQRKAAQTLARQAPGSVRKLSLAADSAGRITVVGSVHTIEEQAQICRALHSLPQCSGIHNHLALVPDRVGNAIRPTTGVTPTGASQITQTPSPTGGPKAQNPATGTNQSPPPLKGNRWDTANLPPPAPVGSLGQATTRTSPTGPSVSMPLQTSPATLGQPYETIALVAWSLPTTSTSLKTPPVSTPPVVVPPVTTPVSKAPPVKVPPVSLPPISTPPAPTPVVKLPPISQPPVVVPPLPVPVQKTTPPVVVPPVPPMPAPPVNVPKVVVPPVPPIPAPPVVTPKVTVPTPAVTIPSLPEIPVIVGNQKNPPRAPELTVPPPATPPTRLPIGQIEKLVGQVCTQNAQLESVRFLANGQLEIKLRVRSEAEGADCFRRIMEIPELGPYNIQFTANALPR